MSRLINHEPQAEQREPVLGSQLLGLGHRPLDLGDLMCGVIDGLTKSFDRHATSVVQARSGNATVIAD